MSGAAPVWRSVPALVANELRLLARRPENLLVAVVVPVVVLVFLSAVPVGAGVRDLESLVPRTLALAVVATAFVNLGIATAYERGYGVLKRLGGAPITRTDLILAKVGAVLVLSVMTGIVLVAVGWLLGWRAPPVGPAPGILLTAIGLGTAAFAGLALALAGSLRAEAVLAIANGLFVGFALFGGLVVPARELPGVLADVARALPSAALADAFRAGLGDQSVDAGRSMLVLGVWAIVTGVVAARTFRWD